MRWIRLTLCLFAAFIIGRAAAQADEPPLLALHEGGIYAVSPFSGEATALVPAPENIAELRELTHDPVTLFSADWLSPDGSTLVYRTLAADALARARADAYAPDHALYALDLHTNAATEIALPQHYRADVTVQSLAWSADGTRLAVVLFSRPLVGEAGWSLAVYASDSWESLLTVPLPEPAYATSRRIVAGGDSFTLVDTGIQGPHVTFTRLDADGKPAESIEIDDTISPDVNLYILAPFNPLRDGETWRYGLNRQLTGDLFTAVDLATGALVPYDSATFPALVSSLAPETSLRVSAVYYDGDMIGLLLRNAETRMIGDTPIIKAYSFGISGDSDGSTFALSPDGQSLAFLESGALRLWTDGEVTPLDFSADALAWAPPRYVPVVDSAYLAG